MNNLRILLFTLLLSSFSFLLPKSTFGNPVDYDICIYGATSSGVVAAYTAIKMGKRVILIATDQHIGGLSSGGLGKTDIGNKQVIGGISRDFYKRLGKIYGQPEAWLFEPSAASNVFDQYIKEAKIPIIFDKQILHVEKQQAQIKSITLVSSKGSQKKKQKITASVFMDCTYEGDLLALAGVSFAIGREDNTVYGETNSGFQLPAYRKVSGFHQFPDGVSPYIDPKDPTSGLLWGVSEASVAQSGSGDSGIQAYNFRICLTDSAENRIPITKPEGYDPKKYELLVRLFQAQPDVLDINRYFIWSKMPGRKTDVNNRGAFSTDMIGANHKWPEANFSQRAKLFQEHLEYTKGLLYFFVSDQRVPDSLRNFVSKWGYPKDEYVKTNNFTPQLYVREGRRMIGEYVMTEHNCTGKEKISDPIGMAAYQMDSHNVQRIVVNGMVKNEGNVEIGGFKPYPISFRSITPKRDQCTNLLVPVSLSSSHISFGSIRMEPVFMVLGQSAAVAAVHAIDENKPVQSIDYSKLREKLLSLGQILRYIPKG